MPVRNSSLAIEPQMSPPRPDDIGQCTCPASDYLSLPAVRSPERRNDRVAALGFPAYAPGDQLSKRPGQIYGSATRHAVKLLEVSATLSDGMSGGPITNDLHQVIGIAHKGGGSEHKQLAIEVSELLKLASE